MSRTTSDARRQQIRYPVTGDFTRWQLLNARPDGDRYRVHRSRRPALIEGPFAAGSRRLSHLPSSLKTLPADCGRLPQDTKGRS